MVAGVAPPPKLGSPLLASHNPMSLLSTHSSAKLLPERASPLTLGLKTSPSALSSSTSLLKPNLSSSSLCARKDVKPPLLTAPAPMSLKPSLPTSSLKSTSSLAARSSASDLLSTNRIAHNVPNLKPVGLKPVGLKPEGLKSSGSLKPATFNLTTRGDFRPKTGATLPKKASSSIGSEAPKSSHAAVKPLTHARTDSIQPKAEEKPIDTTLDNQSSLKSQPKMASHAATESNFQDKMVRLQSKVSSNLNRDLGVKVQPKATLLANEVKLDEEETDVTSQQFELKYDEVVVEPEPGARFPMPVHSPDAARDNPLDQLQDIKRQFINLVSGALIAAPNFSNPEDPTVVNLRDMMDKLSTLEPEFILKVALYSRCELNLRTVTSYLLAFSANNPECRPYLKRYYGKSINLPSDWIEVAEIFQQFVGRQSKHGNLSAALRRAMAEKFPDFDEYQLGKYNKEGRAKKFKMKRIKGKMVKVPIPVPEKKNKFTIKQLIRQIHITEPPKHVMSILGKKYPKSAEQFSKCRLPGSFDSELAGKRMRLPVPETWETQISSRGNKAEVWQDLLDHNKLPFMAMLRNLRNLIKAGISEAHHNKVIKRLTDVKSVVRSRQFPFRFFSAFVALDELEKEWEKAKEEEANPPPAKKATPKRKVGKRAVVKKIKPKKPLLYSKKQLAAYKSALGKSVKIATTYNLKPIPNRTLVLLNASDLMYIPCTSAKAFGQPKQVVEVAVLLALMCQHACESSQLVIYHERGHDVIPQSKGNILTRTQHVLQLAGAASGREPAQAEQPRAQLAKFPHGVLWDLIVRHEHVDNILLLSRGKAEECRLEEKTLKQFLPKYRQIVNPDLLFVNVDLSGGAAKVDLDEGLSTHPNDVLVSGFSDQLLRFVAERGNQAQLQHVNRIDRAYGLDQVKVHLQFSKDRLMKEPQLPELSPLVDSSLPKTTMFREVKVFISSTFKDMNTERDLLVRDVMPRLRREMGPMAIKPVELDMRWGIVEEDPTVASSLEVCLRKVHECDIFVCLLGQRYGFAPQKYLLPSLPEFAWTRHEPPGRSITAMELLQALHDHKPIILLDRTRINCTGDEKPGPDFVSEGGSLAERMAELKELVRERQAAFGISPGHVLVHRYKADFSNGAVRRDSPELVEMLSVVHDYLKEKLEAYQTPMAMDEVTRANAVQSAFVQSQCASFVGRAQQLRDVTHAIDRLAPTGGVVLVKGRRGIGKTAFMSALYTSLCESPARALGLHAHLLGQSAGDRSVERLLHRLMYNIKSRHQLHHMPLPTQLNELRAVLEEYLTTAVFLNRSCRSPLVFLVDALDTIDNIPGNARNLDWIPSKLPRGVVFVISAETGSNVEKKISERPLIESFSLPALSTLDKRAVMGVMLAQYGKTLDQSSFNNQMSMLTSKKESEVPLYLELACHELRNFSNYEKLNAKLKSLPQTIPALIETAIKSTEVFLGFKFVSTALCILHLSPQGLSERDLLRLLSVSRRLQFETSASLNDVTRETGRRVISVSTLAFNQLTSALQLLYSSSHQGTLKPRSEIVNQVIEHKYLAKLDRISKVTFFHRLLQAYFTGIAEKDGKLSLADGRCYERILYHAARAGEFTSLKQQHLLDLAFLEKCIYFGQSAQLIAAYDFQEAEQCLLKTTSKEVDKLKKDEHLTVVKTFLTSNMHILSRAPSLIYQQASIFPGSLGFLEPAARPVTDLDLHWSNRPDRLSPCTMTWTDLASPGGLCLAASDATGCLAVGTGHCSVKIFNVNTGKEVGCMDGFGSAISSVAFVGDSKIVVATSEGGMYMHSLADLGRVAEMKGHDRRVARVAASGDGLTIVSCSWDCYLRLWRASNGSFESDIQAAPCPINSVDFDPNRSAVAIGCWDKTVKIWNLTSKKQEYAFRGHVGSVRDAVYSPDGTRIVSASLDGEVRLWSVTQLCPLSVLGSSLPTPINSLAFARGMGTGGSVLLGACSDGKVTVWGGDIGERQPGLSCPAGGDSSALCVAFSRDGALAAVGYGNGALRVVHAKSRVKVFTCAVEGKKVTALDWTEDGQFVLFSTDHALFAAPADQEDGAGIMHEVFSSTDSIQCLAACGVLIKNTQRQVVALGFSNGILKLFSFNRSSESPSMTHLMDLAAHEGAITQITFNKSWVITAGRDTNVHMWDLRKIKGGASSARRSLNNCHRDWVTSVCAANNVVLTGSADHSVKLWRKGQDGCQAAFLGHAAAIVSLYYNQELGIVISCDASGVMKTWKEDGALLSSVRLTQKAATCVSAASVTVMRSAEKSSDNIDDIFAQHAPIDDWAAEVDKSELLEKQSKTLLASENQSNSSSRLGSILLAACCDDGHVTLWRPLIGQNLGQLIGHSGVVYSAVTTGDSSAFTSGRDCKVKRWDLSEDLSCSRSLIHGCSVSALSLTGIYVISADIRGKVNLSTIDGRALNTTVDSTHEGVVTGAIGMLAGETDGVKESGRVADSSDLKYVFTCGLDGLVKKLRVVIDGENALLKLEKEVRLPSAVQKMRLQTVNEHPMLRGGGRYEHVQLSFLVCACWDGVARVVDTECLDTGANAKQSPLPPGGVGPSKGAEPDWCVDVGFAQAGVPGTANSVLHCEPRLDRCYLLTPRVGGRAGPHVRTALRRSRVDERVTCGVIGARGETVVGMTGGFLSLPNSGGDRAKLTQVKLHEDDVSAVQLLPLSDHVHLLLTAARDDVIKFWLVTSGDFARLSQVGEFHCDSPVTSLEAVTRNQSELELAAGDSLGNVYSLKIGRLDLVTGDSM